MDPRQLEALIPLAGVFMGGLIVLVPIIGITARIALKPVMEAFARYQEVRGDVQMVHVLEQRVALMEEQLHSIERSVGQLAEGAEFHRHLQSGARVPAEPGVPPS